MQDRVGRPVSDRKGFQQVLDQEFWAQASGENGHFVSALYVSGMTCSGCAWLVQCIALREADVANASVSLVSGRIELHHGPAFDFSEFQAKLSRFAYSLSFRPSLGLSLSPILVRVGLSTVFSVNGGLLLYLSSTMRLGESLSGLLSLFSLVNLMLLMFVGGSLFLRPAWDGLRFGQMHSDLVPSLILIALLILGVGEALLLLGTFYFSLALFVCVPLFVFARACGDYFENRIRIKS